MTIKPNALESRILLTYPPTVISLSRYASWFLYNSRISIKFIPNTPSTVLKILSSDAMHRKCIFLLYKEMCQMPYIVYYSTEVVITQPLTRAIIYNSPIIHRLSHRLFTISYLQYLIYNIYHTYDYLQFMTDLCLH